MKAIGLIILAMLSGCATYFDSQDPCQQEPYPAFVEVQENQYQLLSSTTIGFYTR